jgi:regulator of sigma E protease
MIEVLQSILALLVSLSILVTVHEFGHYWMARKCGVHVLRFCVGFGKPIYTYRVKPIQTEPQAGLHTGTRSNEPLPATEFCIAAIPLGGYVKMLDQREAFVADDQVHYALNGKPVLQRIAIAAAGPIANFLLAILAYWLLFASGVTGIIPVIGTLSTDSPAHFSGLKAGQEILQVDGHDTPTWSEVNLKLFERLGETGSVSFQVSEAGSLGTTGEYEVEITDWLVGEDEPRPARALGLVPRIPKYRADIGEIVPGGRAEQAGLRVGDRITAINGVALDSWADLVRLLQANAEVSLKVDIARGGQASTLLITPAAVVENGRTKGVIGAARLVAPWPKEMLRKIQYPIYSAWLPAVEKTIDISVFTLGSIIKMIEGVISPKNLSGPITIAQIANQTAQSGLESFIGFIALLSISLGIINLLPIPMLDGGHLLYYMVELLTGKALPEKIQEYGYQLGLALILGIMVLAFYNDFMRL